MKPGDRKTAQRAGMPVAVCVDSCDKLGMYSLLERVPPSILMIEVAAGIGTLTGGLKFATYFILGVGVMAAGSKLDSWGLDARRRPADTDHAGEPHDG